MKDGQELQEILGKNVKSRRKHREWSQDDLGDRIGITRNSVHEIEKGYNFASSDTLVKLAKAFETEVYELLKPEGVLPDYPADIISSFQDEVKDAVENVVKRYQKK